MIAELFNLWNRHKQRIDSENLRLFYHEREVWWAQIGKNIGFEQDGKNDGFLRPVIILKKFNKQVFWGIPLTTKDKIGRFYSSFEIPEKGFQNAILSQLRLFDAKRLRKKMGEVPLNNFLEIKQKITLLLNEGDS